MNIFELKILQPHFNRVIENTLDVEYNKDGTKKLWLSWDRIVSALWDNQHIIAKGTNLFWFNHLYYEPISQMQFRAMLANALEPHHLPENICYKVKRADEVYNQFCDHFQLAADQELDVEDVIPFMNGYLASNGQFLKTDDPEVIFEDYFITRVIPYPYEPDFQCPNFDYLMKVIIPDQADRRKILIFLAYTLLPMKNNLRYHQCWWGGGNNGKSQLAEHWAALLGPLANMVSLNALLNDKHAMVGLRGCYLNVSSEVKGVMMNTIALDRCKDLLTAAYLTGRDVFESQKSAKYPNRCRHLITANDLPYSEYMSEDMAFFSRWDLIHWEYVWNDADWQEYKDETGTTKHVFDNIFKAEAASILSYICSFRNALNELHIDSEKTKREWVCAGNSAIAFVHNRGITDKFDTIKRLLFDQYEGWCERNLRKKLTYQTFFQTLKHRGYNEVRQSTPEDGYIYLMEALSYDQQEEERLSQKRLDTLLEKVINEEAN